MTVPDEPTQTAQATAVPSRPAPPASAQKPAAAKAPQPAPAPAPGDAKPPSAEPAPDSAAKAKPAVQKPEAWPASDLPALYGKAGEHLAQGNRLLLAGDFKSSFAENEKALALSGAASPGDIALFNMGLIYAHQNNPEKDYKKSIAYFNRLLNEFPKSGLAEQAKIWIGVLDVIEKSKQVDIEIELKKKELNR